MMQMNSVSKTKKQRGVALIIVLMIVALVSVLATQMGARLQLNVARASNIKDNNQAYWYAMGAEQFARKSIVALMERNKEVLSLENNWSETFAFPLEGGGIEAQLTDLQSCFNLNGVGAVQGNNNSANNNNSNNANGNNTNASAPNGNTANTSANKGSPNGNSAGNGVSEEALAFERLVNLAVPDLDNYTAEVARDSLIDWLDADENMSLNGAEDADYAALPNPYLAANTSMMSKTELRLVNGVQPQWLSQLLPFICVVPGMNELKINVNTVTEDNAVVLAALTGADINDIQSVINSRPPEGFPDVPSFMADPRINNLQLSATQQKWLDVKSEYFILHTKTHYNNASFMMSSVFKFENDKVVVIRREFGGVS